MNLDDLRGGSLLYTQGKDGKAVPMRLATLFRTKGDETTFGLVTASPDRALETETLQAKTSVYSTKDFRPMNLVGHLEEAAFPLKDDALSMLFSVFVLEPKYGKTLKRISHSKDIINNAFGPRPMKLRRIPTRFQGKRKSTNKPAVSNGPKGHLVGDVLRARIKFGNRSATLERAGLVRSFGKRSFADYGDSGAPIMSTNKRHALVGFVVGKLKNEVLFVPAEDLAARHNIEFFGPDSPEPMQAARSEIKGTDRSVASAGRIRTSTF